MDKKTRKEIIDRLALIAKQVYDEISRSNHGVVSFDPHRGSPGAHLQPALFMELFGDDTEYEYIDSDYGKYVVTNVKGATVFALINGTDMIQKGRIV